MALFIVDRTRIPDRYLYVQPTGELLSTLAPDVEASRGELASGVDAWRWSNPEGLTVHECLDKIALRS